MLVDRYQAPLHRYFVRLVGEPDTAADLTQATLLAAFRRLDRLTERHSFAAWLFKIARNQARMEWRRQRVRRGVSLEWLLRPGGTRAQAPVPELTRPDASLAVETRDQIQRTLDGLSPSLREALVLHHVCGFRGQEVAQILGISTAAARKRIGRADAEFRRRYGAGG